MSISLGRWSDFTLEKVQVLIAEWVFISILMFYPFFASVSILIGIESRPLSLLYRGSYLGATLLILFLEFARKSNKVKTNVFVLSFILFWLIYLGRMYHDLVHLGITRGYAARGFIYYFQFGILGSFMPVLMLCFTEGRMNYERFFKNLKLIAWLTAFCLFYIVNHEYGFGLNIFLSRFSLGEDANIISPILISQYGGIIAVLAFYSMKISKVTFTSVIQWLLGLTLLILGSSRGPFIGVVLIHIFIYWIFFKSNIEKISVWRNLIITLLIIMGLFIAVVLPNLEKINMLNRIQGSVSQGKGLDDRGSAWSSAWNQFLGNPIFGDKIIENHFGFYPHNLVLEILMATGLLGLIVLLPLIFKICLNYLNILRIDEYQRAFIILFLLSFIFVSFSSALVTMPHFWILLAISVSISPKKLKTS